MKFLFALFLTVMALSATAQTDTVFLKNLLESNPELFAGILKHPNQNEVQILYTRIDRDARNKPHFTSFSYRLDARRYFYPASTVKLPTVIFALEKLNLLHIPGLTKEAAMLTDSSYNGQTSVLKDTSAASGLPSIAQYIKKVLLVSDNDSFNRLYEFTGRAQINTKLKKYGLHDTRIISRLAVGDHGESAKHTNAIRFYNGDKLVYEQPAQYDAAEYPMPMNNLLQGKGYLDGQGKLVMEPFDFSDKNVFTITDQQMVLRRLMFPESFNKDQRFNLTSDDYRFIYKYMSMFPTESSYPSYPRPAYYPAYCKFLFYGSDPSAVIYPDIRIFNKVGDSYGYDIDNAYIVDFKNKVEFMLTVVVQSNEDGIYNDDKYEYTTVCLPLLKNLGQVIYRYELNRIKKHLPDLSAYQFKY